MGLFSKKSEEQKRAEDKIDELCGGFLGNDTFNKKLEENGLEGSASNVYYKSVLKDEIKNNTLDYDDIESRLDELMKLDVDVLNNKIKYKEDTSLFRTQQDINEFMGEKYTEKHNRTMEKREEKRIKNLDKENSKIRKLEEKFNIDLTGKTWFECTIEEVKYSTIYNEPHRDVDTAYVIISDDNVEILKESMFIKSNMGSRKIFYENITSIDYDARGKFHLSSGMIINTKSAEHIQLKNVSENEYNLLKDAYENYIRKPQETMVFSQSSKADDLVKYAELYEKGLISEEEFNKLKNEIIHGQSSPDFNEVVETNPNEEINHFCTNCGTKVVPEAKFCPDCGNKLD